MTVLLRTLATTLIFSAAFVLTSEPAHCFEAASWKPPHRPAWRGALARNHELASCLLIGKGKLKGPEDVAVDDQGRLYCGTTNGGQISRITITADGAESIQNFANTGGAFNLGLKLASNGDLYVCNVPLGLFKISPKGEVTLLTNKCDDGSPITFADDIDIDSQGKVYFSDASSKYNGQNGKLPLRYDLLEGNPYGSLYVYDPADKSTKLLLKGLYFGNGVALSKNEDYVLVNETGHYQITRYWLKGPKAGTHDLFASNLPGCPDGIVRDEKGDYWVSIPLYRRRHLDYLQHSPHIKNGLSHAPVWAWGKTPHYGLAIRLNEAGEIVESLHDPHGKVWCVTNVVPWKEYLYLGTLEGDAIARYKRASQ